jgi:hypothetical protein
VIPASKSGPLQALPSTPRHLGGMASPQHGRAGQSTPQSPSPHERLKKQLAAQQRRPARVTGDGAEARGHSGRVPSVPGEPAAGYLGGQGAGDAALQGEELAHSLIEGFGSVMSTHLSCRASLLSTALPSPHSRPVTNVSSADGGALGLLHSRSGSLPASFLAAKQGSMSGSDAGKTSSIVVLGALEDLPSAGGDGAWGMASGGGGGGHISRQLTRGSSAGLTASRLKDNSSSTPLRQPTLASSAGGASAADPPFLMSGQTSDFLEHLGSPQASEGGALGQATTSSQQQPATLSPANSVNAPFRKASTRLHHAVSEVRSDTFSSPQHMVLGAVETTDSNVVSSKV